MRTLRDRQQLERFLRRNAPLNIYSLGDLDPFFFPAHAPSTRVAALGNVTTLPQLRGRGLARAAVAVLCRRLLRTVDTVGLNAHADNAAALALYRRLGFEPVAEYLEFAAHRP